PGHDQMVGASAATLAVLVETTDAPRSADTPYTMSVGDTFIGTVEVDNDRDWIAITLEAGVTYSISLAASGDDPLNDPWLLLRDESGELLDLDDDSGPESDALLTFTPWSTGTYYIEAGPYKTEGDTGGYTLSVSENLGLPTFTYDEIADQLTDGYWNCSGGRSARSFDVGPGGTITVNITALTAEGQFLAQQALAAWTNVTGINFAFVLSGGQIIFDNNQSGAFSTSEVIGNTIQSSNVNVSTGWLEAYGATIDSDSFQAYIHEIGHAL